MKNETRYTVEAINALNRHTMRRQIIWFFFSIVLLVYLFIDLFVRHTDQFTTLLIIYIVLSGLLLGTMGFTLWTNARRKTAKSGILDTVLRYAFEKEGFKLIIVTKDKTEERYFAYGKLKRVTDKGRYLFIYVASSSALILDKNGFTQPQSVDELKILLTKNNVRLSA